MESMESDDRYSVRYFENKIFLTCPSKAFCQIRNSPTWACFRVVYSVKIYWKKYNLKSHCVKSVQIRSFFWSVFSCIRIEYGEIRSISPYSVWMWENTDQKKLRIWTLFTHWLFHLMYVKLNWIDAQKSSESKKWVSHGSQNLNIRKSDWGIGIGKLLPWVSGFYRDVWQVSLTDTEQVIYQHNNWIKIWFLIWQFLEGSMHENQKKKKRNNTAD